jgi:mono/diheme cytochrome c family protein
MHRAVRIILPGIWFSSTVLVWPSSARAQNDAGKIYKTNCVLCHAPDGSGSTPTGKALKADDLRSDVVQKKTDAELTAAITNGKGKMPAFGKKLKPDDIAQLVAFIRALPK